MKIVKKPIEMIAWFTQDGIPNPIRFRIKGRDESWIIIKVDRILQKDTEKLAGNKMHVFRCQSIINDEERVYEIKYELDTCRWFLFKI